MDELINRQAVIDILDVYAELLRRVLDDTDIVGAKRTKYEWGLGLIESCIADVKGLSFVQPKQRLIPCSEKLPKDRRQVLVYARNVGYVLAKYDEMREADGTYKKQWVTFDAWKPYYTIKEVIAWMPVPVPEPYAERSTDEGD